MSTENPIVKKDTVAVDSVGPFGAASTIDIRGANQLYIVNDGADDVNLSINSGVTSVNEDGYRLKTGEFLVMTIRGMEEFFLVCASGQSASVRYLAFKLPTIRGHF